MKMKGKLLQYLQGYLCIRISGQAVERFINTCSYKGIKLWGLTPKPSYYEVNILVKDFKKLKPVIRKTRTKVTIVKRTGFPFFINQYKNRRLLIAGLFICIFLVYFSSKFIWNIEITGNYSNSTENIMLYLNSLDIKTGIKKTEVDCYKISRKLRQSYDDIIWVSASVNGTNLIVQIKENFDTNEMLYKTENVVPYDIVADDSYVIADIVIRSGIVNVKKGDSVKTGDILVSGQIPVHNDAKEIINYQYCIADADIYGKKTIHYEDELPYITYDKHLYETKKTEYFFKIGFCRFRFGSIHQKYAHFMEYSKQNKIGPFTYGIREVVPYEKKERDYSRSEIQEILTSNFKYYCKELEKKGVVILKNNVKINTWSDQAKATGELLIKQPFGRKVKSQLLETGDHIDGNDGNNN